MKKILLNFVILIAVCMLTLTGCKDDLTTSKEQDEQKLRALYQEIETLAGQFTCENANEWTFVSLGAKGCGGSIGYIAYSTKINENDFLKKVNAYTDQQKVYNIKWNIMSDCLLVAEPKGVECNNGKPKFVY